MFNTYKLFRMRINLRQLKSAYNPYNKETLGLLSKMRQICVSFMSRTSQIHVNKGCSQILCKADEIEKVAHDIDQRIRQKNFAGDIFPTNVAPIIEKSEHGLKLDVCKWGYPLSQGKNLVINARAESVMDKPSFRNGILYHRILIPASGFYEWNRLKKKNTFSRYDAPVLYMAGFCDWFENERRFVIMTTAANESMIKVHDRMPLILEKGQLKDWFDDKKMEQILHQVTVQLKREAEYEQQSLFL